jgi:hypothetical protein
MVTMAPIHSWQVVLPHSICRWIPCSTSRHYTAVLLFPEITLAALQELLCQRLSEDWEQVYAQVAQLITHTVRASSAVACMNSVLRMHQNRHRSVSQQMLDLKRLFWNCRRFTHGKRRGACPYPLLGRNLPTYNWWKLLQMDPEELRQQLSTQEVAA